jgi:hypothetical protein
VRPAGPAASGVLAAGFMIVAPVALGHGSAPAAATEPVVETAAEVATALTDCAGRLGPEDVGLARVALRCPGIEYHLEYGPLARSARGSGWARHVDASRLRAWATVAASYGVPSSDAAPSPALLAPLLARAQAAESVGKGLWQRWLERLEAIIRGQRELSAQNPWLERIFGSLSDTLPSFERVRSVVEAVLVLLACALAVYLLRSARAGRERGRRAAGLAAIDPRPQVPRPGSLPEALEARVAARFAAAIERIDVDGVMPGARARTCRELSRRLADAPGAIALAPLAPLVEQATFAAVPPDRTLLAAADEALAAFEAARR